MVNFGGEKMSKSLGNVVSIRRVAETHDLEALRLLLISVHYRSPVAFTIGPEENGRASLPDLDEAEARLEYFYRTLERLDGFLATAGSRPASRRADRVPDALREPPWTTTSTRRRWWATCTTPFVLVQQAARRAQGAAEGRAAGHPGRPTGATCAAAGETLGILQRPPGEFLLARRSRLCARREIDARRGRGAHRRSRRRARAPGTSPAPTRSAPSCARAASS